MPGATIKAIRQEDGKATKAVSDETGSYVLLSLPPGSYVISAELPGFRKATHGPVAITGGERLSVDFRMRLAALDHVDYVQAYNTLDELVAKSDIVAYLLIDHIDSATEWEMTSDSSVMGVLITARLIVQVKNHGTYGSSGAQLQFLHFGSSSPHRDGQEYVSFLTWDENAKHFVELAGDVYMIEIAKSRVATTTSLKAVRVGMPVVRLLEQLRSLVKLPDR